MAASWINQNNELTDFFISVLNKLSYTGGGITLGSLAMYKEQVSIVFSGFALAFTAMTFFISLYFQSKRNRREEAEERRRALIFEQVQEERRLHLDKDTGERRRESDEN